MTCEKEDREAEVSMTFSVCVEHGEAKLSSGSITSGGVALEHLIPGMLATVEETIIAHIRQSDALNDFMTTNYGGKGVLREAAQRQLAGVFAHQAMLAMVAERAWPIGNASALLTIPRLE